MSGAKGAVTGRPLGWLITKAAAALSLRLSRSFAETGLPLSPEQYGVLSLVCRGTDLSQAEVARALGRDGPSVTRLVDGLEDGGLVERRRRDGDRRAYLLVATEKGKGICARAEKVIAAEESILRACLPESAIPAMESCMARIVESFGQ